jgi:hypothetical protein
MHATNNVAASTPAPTNRIFRLSPLGQSLTTSLSAAASVSFGATEGST